MLSFRGTYAVTMLGHNGKNVKRLRSEDL